MAHAQDNNTNEDLPYAIIPKYPEEYNAGTISARVVDGLGFRYYWATDELREEDLLFKPNDDARTAESTIDHIYQLTSTMKNAVSGLPTEGRPDIAHLRFDEKRAVTLKNIKAVSDILLSSSDEDIASYKLLFKRKDGSNSEYPFWNLINGPLADAIWHVGQIVSFRRSSGNPFNSKVNVLNGQINN